MSEIFVEEENTVYEIDEECLRMKERQEKRQKQAPGQERYKVQGVRENKKIFWILCILFIIIRS